MQYGAFVCVCVCVCVEVRSSRHSVSVAALVNRDYCTLPCSTRIRGYVDKYDSLTYRRWRVVLSVFLSL